MPKSCIRYRSRIERKSQIQSLKVTKIFTKIFSSQPNELQDKHMFNDILRYAPACSVGKDTVQCAHCAMYYQGPLLKHKDFATFQNKLKTMYCRTSENVSIHIIWHIPIQKGSHSYNYVFVWQQWEILLSLELVEIPIKRSRFRKS